MSDWLRDPWSRLDDEPAADFDLFATYRDIGMTRTIGKCAALTGKSPQTLKEKSQKWAWYDRALSWDDHVDEATRREFKQELVDTKKRVVLMATEMQRKIAQRLMTLNPDEMSPRDLVTWFQVSTQLQLKALGEADQKVELTGANGEPLQLASEMSAQERAAMMAALAGELMGMLPKEEGPGELEGVVEGDIVEEEES